MATMFVHLRRLVYLLVLLQCCVCVVRADDAEKTTAVNFLTKWADESEKHLAEGKSYQLVWNTTVGFCDERADKARKAAEKTEKLVEGIAAEKNKQKGANVTGKNLPVSPELVQLVENVSAELDNDMRVFGEAMGTVEKARNLVTWSSGAIQNMQDKLVSQNGHRVHYTGVLEEVPEDKRTEEQQLLIERSKRVYKEMDEVYQHLQVIKKKSVACTRETNQLVMETKNKMLRTKELFEGLKQHVEVKSKGVEEKVNLYDQEVKKSLEKELPEDVTFEQAKGKEVMVGRASNSTIGGAATLARENRTVETTELWEKLGAEKIKEEGRLKQKKVEEERELKKRIEERKLAAERRRQEEEWQKQAAAAEAQRVRKEQERKKREEQAKKERDEKAKREAEEEAKRAAEKLRQEAAQKAKEEAEKTKKDKNKKDGSSSPALMHGSLILLVLSVLGYTLVC
ncbi:uncharacterized protein TM35_000432060 [Trypanosoma theileri]|uniref:Transglutaminase n=1 Tax=Trypanosoma theileri TaxID=67003 RepID=A0A1X0NJF4_9TRYP|nr:uncharacterized protein TM35_000432060 [Trypanosoma theileri]ORC84638.1 hypothetical protein TM35_000432060 [Trypanosoma theileri]